MNLFPILFAMAAMSSPSPSKQLSQTPPAVPAMPPTSAKVHVLDNGLTVIIDEDRSAPVASLQAWCASGSIHEGKWLGAGLSHILEHMLFKGTKKRQAGEIARAIQDQGGYINAYTSFDRTVYWIDVPSTGASEALDILCDAMMNSTLPEDEYAKEQEVIRREFAMGFDDPNRQGIQLLLRTIFPQSPYGLPVIGHLDVYNRLTRDDVMEYYLERYVPNNLTFVITGDVDEKAILAQLEKFFGDYPRGKLAPVPVPEEPPQMGRREAHEEFPTELSRLYMAWKVPGLDDPDAAALEILGSILGGGRSSVLNLELRERNNLVHTVSAGVYSMQSQGIFFVFALCDPDKRELTEKETLAAIERVQSAGVSPTELEKARRGMLADLLGSLTTARGKASGHGSNWLLTRNLDFGNQFLESVARVTSDDIRRVAKKYLSTNAMTVTSLNPEGSLQGSSDVAEVPESAPVQKFDLPNGLRLLVREDSRLPLVSITSAFRGGLLAESAENNGITKLLSRSLIKGTDSRSAEEIAELIEGVGGSIGSDAGNNTYSISVGVMKSDLALGLELLADILQNPSFPEREVEIEKNSQLAEIKAEEDQITSVARNLMRKSLFGNHPYSLRGSGSSGSVSSLTPEALREFHQEHTVAANGVISVFGDVKAKEVLTLVEKYFAAMPVGKLALESPKLPEPITAPISKTEEKDKQQAVLMVGYLGGSISSPDRPALEILASASSDLGSRFFDRIREQMGLAYFVGAAQMNGLAPGLFAFYVGTDPAKADQVAKALNDEIRKLATEGLTEVEIERAKKKLLGAEAIGSQSNSAFGARSAVDELVGLGYDHYQKREAELQGVTLEKVREVATNYFAESNPVEVLVRPPKGPVESEPVKTPESP